MSGPARTVAAAVLAVGLGLIQASYRADGVAAQEADRALTLRMIVVGSADAAERIVERARKGESFAVLARAESTAPSAESGGWLGKLPISQLRPEVRRALDGLRPGDVTAVIRLPTGYAVFRVEDEAGAPGAVSSAINSTGAVKYVLEVSGFGEARVQLDLRAMPSNWHMNLRDVCEARTRAVDATRRRVEAFLSPANRAALTDMPRLDLMHLHAGLAQLAAYEGRMADAVARFGEAHRIALNAGVFDSILQMEQSLGIVHLHKADGDNGVQARPGELCLLHLWEGRSYPDKTDAQAAIGYFSKYLERKPDEREVWWLLNLAHMRAGTYPDHVPKQFLIPPSAFASTESFGRFRDVAHEAGLGAVLSAGGAVVDDFRGTGLFDVVVSTMDNCESVRMFANNGDGTFTDVTASAGLANQLGGLNVIQGDYDNDACPDLLVLRGGWEDLPQRKSLLRNDCRGRFTDVTVESGLAAVATSTQTAVWTDIDNDGWLDLFVGNENAPAQLFRNRGDGTFADIAEQAGVARVAFTKGVTAVDYDNDRYPDLYVSNYGGRNVLYRNNGDGTFTDFTDAARVPGPGQGFATWFFDYDNDGWQDLFATSYIASLDEMVRDYLGTPHNAVTMKLYRNQGDATFRDMSREVGLDRVLMPMGANFGDADNDGFLDIYLGTGHPSYAAVAGSVFLHNREGQKFVDVTASSGTGELHKGHGVAFADLDSDGDQDLVFEVGGATPGDRHAMRLFENPGHGNDWISMKLKGVKSNRGGVGARIKVTVTGAEGRAREIHRAVTGGGSFGVSPLQQHVGLGKTAGQVDVEVWWPATDTRQLFTGVAVNQVLHIEESAERYSASTPTPVRFGGAGRAQ
jgi:hypothetical protein